MSRKRRLERTMRHPQRAARSWRNREARLIRRMLREEAARRGGLS